VNLYPTAVILAGGKGSRLQTLGGMIPKCLLPVFGQPLITRQIEQCAMAGAREVIVSTSTAFAPLVRSALDAYRCPDSVTITCVAEERPLGAILGFLALRPMLCDRGVLLVLGDEYFEHSNPFATLAGRTSVPDVILGIVDHSRPSAIACNVVVDGGRVVAVREKPSADQLVGRARWIGVAAFRAGVLAGIGEADVAGLVHFGDLLSWMLGRGASMEPLLFDEIELNLNTVDLYLLASLVEARRHYRLTNHAGCQAIEVAVDRLLQTDEIYSSVERPLQSR
jgi:NDP-sugar pyrophosphorylase family protein